MRVDVLIIGGGIVGLSTAMQLQQAHPLLSVCLVEKEGALATHQTGHNSGVIHAGVYYEPGSLKARFCREGSAATLAFCKEHQLPALQCGKLIVATSDVESARLRALLERCRKNGLDPEWLDEAALTRLEPHIVGQAAIRVASSGIADYPAIARTMGQLFAQAGGQILLRHEVRTLRDDRDGVVVEAGERTVHARHAIVCAGLAADRLARACGVPLDVRIVPFRGEYFRLPPDKNAIVSHLIYPVPDPSLPFLGVHLTRMIGGFVTVGPNAVLALAREGYRWRDVSARDLLEMAAFGGFWRLMLRHRRAALREFGTSIRRGVYLKECRKYCPELTLSDLQPYPSGVRAQAVRADGTMVHDFLVVRSRRCLHVCNAPSPAATAAIPIGRHLVQEFDAAFGPVHHVQALG